MSAILTGFDIYYVKRFIAVRSQFKLIKLVMFLAMAGARFEG